MYRILLFIIACGFAVSASAAPEDYSTYPEQHFRFHHLEAELAVSDDPVTIDGEVRYRISAYLDGYDEIRLDATGLDINRITLDGNDVDFQVEDNEVIISFGQEVSRDEELQLEIAYQAQPDFGVHRSARGTVWTSSLPASNRHWLPGPDHPRTRLTTDFTFLIDEDKKAVSGGVLEDQTSEDGRARVNWQSEDPLPLSDIGFAVGNFIETDAQFGIRRLRVFAEEDVFSDEDADDILQAGYNRLRQAEGDIGYSFPFDQFSIVMLEDDYWEPRSFSAGMGWLYSIRGSMEDQIYPVLYSQWFGIYRQMEQWKDAPAMLGYQSRVGHMFADGEVPEIKTFSSLPDHPETVYSRYTADSLNRARTWFEEYEDEAFPIAIDETASYLLSADRQVYTWNDISDIWYTNIGLLWDEAPIAPHVRPPDTLDFIADVSFSGSAGRVTFNFEPVDHNTDRSIPANVRIYKNDGAVSEEIEIPGSGGEVRISLEEQVQTAYVESGINDPVRVDEDKSISMWLYQLRNAESASARKQAAKALGDVEDDPDLQLALRDALAEEDQSEVLAEIYRSLGRLSRGASGTQQTFIDGLHHSSRDVQIASLEALSYYEDNSEVNNEVFEIISLSEDIPKVYKAVGVYRQINSDEYFVDFIVRFLEEDEEELRFTPGLIDEFYRTESTEYAIEHTERYLEFQYPFEIRYKVWNQLAEHDTADERWRNRVESYLNDPDPRMRLLVLSKIHKFDEAQIENLLSDRAGNEFDKRVKRTVEEYLN